MAEKAEITLGTRVTAPDGRDPAMWEESLRKWPHEDPKPVVPQTAAAEQSIFKPGLTSPQSSDPSTRSEDA